MNRFLSALALLIGSGLQAQTLTPNPVSVNEADAVAIQQIEPKPIKLGMSAAQAIHLLGREPDQQTVIGAACGMLEILSWQHEQTRIITSGGVVSSVSKPHEQ